MHLEPQQLRVFAAVLREGSTSRASLDVGTSRSNVRRIWQNIEEQLGERLFVGRENGDAEPTAAARQLEREMGALLDEVRQFESSVRKIHQSGRVLRLGADCNLFNSGHFGRLFNDLRHDPRFRITFVEVTGEEGRAALESGACDLLFTVDGTAGKRFETRDLPPISLDVACPAPRDGRPMAPSDLSGLRWSLATFTGPQRSVETLHRIQEAGGGRGQLCPQQQFLRWAEDRCSTNDDAVVCVRPMSFRQMQHVTFCPLDFATAYPLKVSHLKHHPYEFLDTIVGRMNLVLKESPDGV